MTCACWAYCAANVWNCHNMAYFIFQDLSQRDVFFGKSMVTCNPKLPFKNIRKISPDLKRRKLSLIKYTPRESDSLLDGFLQHLKLNWTSCQHGLWTVFLLVLKNMQWRDLDAKHTCQSTHVAFSIMRAKPKRPNKVQVHFSVRVVCNCDCEH